MSIFEMVGIGILCVIGGLAGLLVLFWLQLIFGKNRNLK